MPLPIQIPNLAGLVEVEASFHFRVMTNLFGRQELVEIKLTGGQDVDGDLLPEFTAELEFLDKDVAKGTVELDPAKVIKAMTGDGNAIGEIIQKLQALVPGR